jgi:hypothetical protein
LIPDIRALTKLKREANQQKGIANGINNGSLNAHEAANLEKREAGLQKLEQRDMAKHNSRLTKAEQRQLNRRENASAAASIATSTTTANSSPRFQLAKAAGNCGFFLCRVKINPRFRHHRPPEWRRS